MAILDPKAMYKLSYGLFVLTTKVGDKVNGCITNTGIQVTSSPNRIAFAVNKANLTHDMLLESGVFNLSVISESAPFSLFERFGFQSGRDVDKFSGFSSYETDDLGVPYILEGTNSYISGKVYQTVDLGSHTLFICDVTGSYSVSSDPSATYEYYQANIKPKPSSFAVGDSVGSLEKTSRTVWRCTVCGYEWEGEELPDDFVCPLCKHPKADFEKVVI